MLFYYANELGLAIDAVFFSVFLQTFYHFVHIVECVTFELIILQNLLLFRFWLLLELRILQYHSLFLHKYPRSQVLGNSGLVAIIRFSSAAS